MILHHEGIILQKGYEALEAVSLKEQTSTRALFRTLAGDLEVTGHARGILRMRFLPVQQQPDYGILQAQTEDLPLSVTGTAEGWRVRSGDVALEILSGPLRVRFYHGDRLLLQSSTDRTIEGHLRFSPFARRQDSWLVALALGVEEPVYGLGEKWAALNRRGQLIHSWNEDATTVNSELSYKNTPFAWSSNGWACLSIRPRRLRTAWGTRSGRTAAISCRCSTRSWTSSGLLPTARRRSSNATLT